MGYILMAEPLRPGEGILPPEGVDMMPADLQLSDTEVSLVNAISHGPCYKRAILFNRIGGISYGEITEKNCHKK